MELKLDEAPSPRGTVQGYRGIHRGFMPDGALYMHASGARPCSPHVLSSPLALQTVDSHQITFMKSIIGNTH